MAKFVMFRDYTNTKGNTKFKPVCLMKINICTRSYAGKKGGKSKYWRCAQ